MKARISFWLLALSGLALTAASCQQGQQAKPIPKVSTVTSSDIKIQHDTVIFNQVMNAPQAPDSIPTSSN